MDLKGQSICFFFFFGGELGLEQKLEVELSELTCNMTGAYRSGVVGGFGLAGGPQFH